MRRISAVLFLSLLALFVFHGNSVAQITALHEFAGAPTDGANPYSNGLVSDGSVFYGMTPVGGANSVGVIFSINPDGSDYELLYEFGGSPGDGTLPYGSLILHGAMLYGMTCYGGAGGGGIIFRINTDGTGYELLHEFAGAADGANPLGSLVSDGSVFYGMTSSGGAGNVGVMFKINPDGSGFELLHEFAGSPSDGGTPYGSLILVGSTLYGMATYGGASDAGVIFRINTDGTAYELLYEFAGGASDGAVPSGDLFAVGSSLYGMTINGGDADYGVIFSVNMDGSGFALLHEFAGGADDGRYPGVALVGDGSTLYGATSNGGETDEGALFKINPDGSGFELLHSFISGSDGGYDPNGPLTLFSSALYGMTAEGGASGNGVVFSLELAQTTSARPIPTLSEWGVIVLAVLLALAALALIKRKALNPTRPA